MGRFAPSPTGLLHRGSLFTALASWLDARSRQGRWLIRLEDLDTARIVPGAAEAILATLERCGMTSDLPVLRQSQRLPLYRAAVDRLLATGHAYRCACSRSEIAGIYDGRCRDRGLADPGLPVRLRLPADAEMAFQDRIQGACRYRASALGDPVILRRDQVPAYQLAVVVDDAAQGVTDVVRGADLLDSTAWQVWLARSLGLAEPRYAHVPLLTEPDGTRLAKSRRSLPVDTLQPEAVVAEMLCLLEVPLPPQLKAATVSDMLGWAAPRFSAEKLAGRRQIALPAGF